MIRSFSMLHSYHRWFAVGLALLSLSMAPMALAREPAPSPSAKLVRRGVELRLRGRDERALVLFQRAHALDGNPVALAQMGEAEHALGRFSEAHEHLEQALLQDDPWIARHRAALERSLADTSRKMGAGTRTSVARSTDRDAPPAPSHAWTRLMEAERAAATSADVLAGIERSITELEARWKAPRSVSNDAAAEVRASIDALKRLLDQCDVALADMDLPRPVELSAEARPETAPQ